MAATHAVFNQVPPLVDYDVADDSALLEGIGRAGVGADDLDDLGRMAGSAEAREWGRLANENPPVLRTHDRYGNRIDEVEFHPSWHELVRTAVEHGLHAAPWATETPGAHLVRAAKFYLWSQAE